MKLGQGYSYISLWAVQDSDHMFYEGKWSDDCFINKQDMPQS